MFTSPRNMANNTAAADAKAKTALAKALRQVNNENSAKFFAAGMAGMIFLFTVFHWSRFALRHYELRRARRVSLLKIPVRVSRYYPSQYCEQYSSMLQKGQKSPLIQGAWLYLWRACSGFHRIYSNLHHSFIRQRRLVFAEQLGKAIGMVVFPS